MFAHWHHTYIKIVDSTAPRGFHTYGVLGDLDANGRGTSGNQQARFDRFDGNSGLPPDVCLACTTSLEQREALVAGLSYWVENPPCPSCGSNYRAFFPTSHGIDGYNSNTFKFNMLFQDPVGRIQPPLAFASNAPGCHYSPGPWYPSALLAGGP
jgi:hypothetical protein